VLLPVPSSNDRPLQINFPLVLLRLPIVPDVLSLLM
jgi:hypothetical protein